MSYKDFQRQCASAGFLATPITHRQYSECIARGVDPYPIACDVAAGFDFSDCLRDAPNIDDTPIVDLLA